MATFYRQYVVGLLFLPSCVLELGILMAGDFITLRKDYFRVGLFESKLHDKRSVDVVDRR